MNIQTFQKAILDWFRKNGRHDLPWRQTTNPYRILVSEIMLQQTQVDRVRLKYKEFLKHFATPKKLAAASLAEVLAVWKGLGYNRRALYLKRAAEMIMRDFAGRFPREVSEIEKLPGVGPYTARAVAVFAFNQPHVFIETNIRRVFIHFFFSLRHPERSERSRLSRDSSPVARNDISDKELMPYVEKALYAENPRLWYSALMDYGALALSAIPNPNRQSRHYTKQSRFQGSRRYARAKILDFLLKHSHASLPLLQEFFQTDIHLDAYIEKPVLLSILTDLYKEGFLTKKKSFWSLVTKP